MDPQLPDRLAERLKHPLPDPAAGRRMEPELALGRHFHRAPPSARKAAVVALLYVRDGQWHLPLVLRPEDMKDHAGQIGLPGGAVEPGEESQGAALRELEEELSIPPDTVRVLGQLTPIWVFATDFAVTPWLAVAPGDCSLRPDPAEVAQLLEVPLRHLLDPAHVESFERRWGAVEFSAPCYRWHEHRIWGATAIVLSELLALVKAVTPSPSMPV